VTPFEPAYLALRVRGELARRVREAWAHLEASISARATAA